MCGPRWHGKGRRYCQYIGSCIGERAVKCRETQVITNRQAKRSLFRPSKRCDNRLGSALISRRFPPCFPCIQVYVEKVDLVITRRNPAGLIDEERAVHPFVSLLAFSFIKTY